MLSSATLMIAPAFTTDVFSLTPALHSVGMVREVAISVDSSLLELKNGIAQATVDARRTGVSSTISGTVFEMTAKNLMISAALDPTTATVVKRGVLTTAAAGAAVSLVYNSDPIPGQANSAIAAVGDVPLGSTILLQRVGGETDYVFPTISTGVTTGTGPWTTPIASGSAIPAGMSFSVGSRVWVLIQAWRRHYNTVRPHSSLGYRPPAPEMASPPYPVSGSASLHLRSDMAAAGLIH